MNAGPERCQAIKINGERCKNTRGLGVVTVKPTARIRWSRATLCGAHWARPPETIVEES